MTHCRVGNVSPALGWQDAPPTPSLHPYRPVLAGRFLGPSRIQWPSLRLSLRAYSLSVHARPHRFPAVDRCRLRRQVHLLRAWRRVV